MQMKCMKDYEENGTIIFREGNEYPIRESYADGFGIGAYVKDRYRIIRFQKGSGYFEEMEAVSKTS